MKKRLGVLILCIIMVATLFNFNFPEQVFAANLLTNSGFESGLWSEKTSGWVSDSISYYEGTKSAKIAGTTTEQYMASEEVNINRFDTYRVTVWIKTDAVSNASAMSINVLEINSSGGAIGWYPSGALKLISTGGTQNWTKYTATLDNFNSSTAKLKIYCRIDANVTGTAWFDAVSLDTINKLTNFSFESGLWSEKTSNVSIDTVDKHSGLQSAKAVGASTDQYMTQNEFSVASYDKYKLSVWIKTSNISTSDGVSMNILQLNSSGGAIGWYSPFKLVATGGTQDWTQYTVDNIGDFASGTISVKVYVRVDASVSGTVWFDDIVFKQKLRDNFIWGVTGHHLYTPSYPESKLDEQIQKVVGAGANTYRINYDPPYVNGVYDWPYMDNMVNACYNNGIKLYVVVYDSLGGDTTYLYNRAKDLATRYKGKIPYYQLGNEQDSNALISGDYDGTQTSHYDTAKYTVIRDKINALLNGIKDGDPGARRVINIAYKHTGFLQLLNNDGLSWEGNAVDWYSDMGDISSTLSTMVGFPQPEVMIGENNIRPGTYGNSEEQQRDYILNTIKQIYYYDSSKIKGYIEYELLDEPVLTERQLIDHFEGTFSWTIDNNNAPASTFMASATQVKEGAYSGKLDYNFNDTNNNYVVLNKEQALAYGQTFIRMWVYGDNSGNMLGIRFKDSTGELFQKEYGAVNWTGWQLVTVYFLDNPTSLGGGDNDGVVDKINSNTFGDTFVGITFDDPTNSYIGSGTIYIDLVVYDLLYEPEAHYGLLNCDRYGNIGAAKLAYTAMYDTIWAKD